MRRFGLRASESDRRVRDRELALGPRDERAELPAIQPFACPVPMDRDVVAGRGVVDEAEPVAPAPDRLDARSSQAKLAAGTFERDAVDEQLWTDPVADDPPPDPALVDDAEDIVRRPAAQQADHREHVEDVEGMDGMRAVRRLGREPPPVGVTDARPEADLVRPGEGGHGHAP